MNLSEKRSEWKAGWPEVVAGLAGMTAVAFANNSLGIFMPELEKDLGWSRTEISSGLTISSMVAIIMFPLVGFAVDRGHTRIIALIAMAAAALVFATFALSSGALVLWWGQWMLSAFFRAGINPAVWSTAVSRRFRKSRGLALSVVLTGGSLSAFTVPLVTRWLIDNFGWRDAYLGLATIYGIFPLVLVWLLFERRGPAIMQPGGNQPAAALSGLTFKEALLDLRVIMIMIATVIGFMLQVGSMVHASPMLMSMGMSPVAAAGGAAVIAVFAAVGKLAFGWVADHAPGNVVGAIAFALPGAGFLMLHELDADMAVVMTAMAIFGLGFGGMLSMTNYLTGRYAGMRSFGKVCGVVTSLMSLGSGLGPLAASYVFDTSKSYDLLLQISVPMAIASGLLILMLGRYPDFERRS